jgi:hypothetical protein
MGLMEVLNLILRGPTPSMADLGGYWSRAARWPTRDGGVSEKQTVRPSIVVAVFGPLFQRGEYPTTHGGWWRLWVSRHENIWKTARAMAFVWLRKSFRPHYQDMCWRFVQTRQTLTTSSETDQMSIEPHVGYILPIQAQQSYGLWNNTQSYSTEPPIQFDKKMMHHQSLRLVLQAKDSNQGFLIWRVVVISSLLSLLDCHILH